MKTGRQHRTDQTNKHYVDKAEELRDKLAEQRRQRLFERLHNEWPQELTKIYDGDLALEERVRNLFAVLLDMSLPERACLWDDAHNPDLSKFYKGFYEAPTGLGKDFQDWVNDGNEVNYTVWHGGYLDASN